MFTLILAAAIAAPAASAPVLVDDPYTCPASQPWAVPSGSEAHPYLCTSDDPGEQYPTFQKVPPVVHPAPVVHHAPRHRAAHHRHHAPKHRHHAAKRHARKAAHR